jgi:hypothetical protein
VPFGAAANIGAPAKDRRGGDFVVWAGLWTRAARWTDERPVERTDGGDQRWGVKNRCAQAHRYCSRDNNNRAKRAPCCRRLPVEAERRSGNLLLRAATTRRAGLRTLQYLCACAHLSRPAQFLNSRPPSARDRPSVRDLDALVGATVARRERSEHPIPEWERRTTTKERSDSLSPR